MTVLRKVAVPSLRDSVSPEEWALRVDLAAAYRLTWRHGWDHLIFNHISARVPGPERHFLLNPYGLRLDEVTASNLVKVDLGGKSVSETPYGIYTPSYTIHSAVHGAGREDVVAAMHIHTVAGMALSALECGLMPITQGAIKLVGRTGYHDYEGHAVELEERARIARDLGDNVALVLRNHGLLTVGRTVSEAFYWMFHLQRSCESQVAALACNTPLRIPPRDVVEKSQKQAAKVGLGPNRGLEIWLAMLRLLDDEDPSYRD